MVEAVKKLATTAVVEKIEDYLEERKHKSDRRQADSPNFPASIERRSGTERRG